MERQSITRTLASFIFNVSHEGLPEEVKDRAKDLLLDALGNVIAGRDLPWSCMALGLTKGCGGDATIFSFDRRVSAMDAAFVNANLIGSIAQDDVLFTFHPGSVIVPTAIAVAEQEGSSGTEVVTALVIGYDVMGRVSLGGSDVAPKFRALPVFGPFGAAAAAGKLLCLNEDQLTSALGYAANLASGLTACWAEGTMEGKFHAGLAARNGIIAADLAKAGATAAEKSLEGERGFYKAFAGTVEKAELATGDIGKRFLIMEATYKPYPVCQQQQIPIDLVLRLVKQYNIDPADIGEVVERVSHWDATFPGSDNAGPFETDTQVVLSAQFCAAAAFLGRPVASSAFYISQFSDPDVAALAKKVKLIGEKDRKLPRIEVISYNGKKYSLEEHGEGLLIPTGEKVRKKFRELTSGIIGEGKADDIIGIVSDLDKCASIRQLTRALAF